MKGGILMNGYKIVVGVDVSKNSFTAAVLYDNKKETFEVKSDPVEFEMKIKPYLKKFKKSDMLIIMEHTGVYHLKLANYLYENDYQVAVVNPFSIKKFMEAKMSRVKTDKADSYFIAEYGRTFFDGELYKPKPDTEKEIEVKLKILEDLQQQLTMLRNKRESLSHVPMKRLKENLEYYNKIIREVEKNIKELEKEIKELSKKNFQEEYKLLKSIPGVSDRVIGVIISIFGGFKRFKSVKEAASFAGLDPSPYESGSSVKKSGKIKKMGNPYARKILYMAALSAIRLRVFQNFCKFTFPCHPEAVRPKDLFVDFFVLKREEEILRFAQNDSLNFWNTLAIRFNKYCRELYERLVSKGKAKKLALVAVAHKLLRQTYGVLKSRRPFDENFCT
jgi:transposase